MERQKDYSLRDKLVANMMDAGYLEGAVEKNAQIVETDYWCQPRALAELDAVMMTCLFTWPVSLFILFMMW